MLFDLFAFAIRLAQLSDTCSYVVASCSRTQAVTLPAAPSCLPLRVASYSKCLDPVTCTFTVLKSIIHSLLKRALRMWSLTRWSLASEICLIDTSKGGLGSSPQSPVHASQKIEAVIAAGFGRQDVLEVATELHSPASWMTLLQVHWPWCYLHLRLLKR